MHDIHLNKLIYFKKYFQDLLGISKQDLRSEMTVAKNCIKSSCDKNDFKLEDIKKYVSKQVYQMCTNCCKWRSLFQLVHQHVSVLFRQ